MLQKEERISKVSTSALSRKNQKGVCHTRKSGGIRRKEGKEGNERDSMLVTPLGANITLTRGKFQAKGIMSVVISLLSSNFPDLQPLK